MTALPLNKYIRTARATRRRTATTPAPDFLFVVMIMFVVAASLGTTPFLPQLITLDFEIHNLGLVTPVAAASALLTWRVQDDTERSGDDFVGFANYVFFYELGFSAVAAVAGMLFFTMLAWFALDD